MGASPVWFTLAARDPGGFPATSPGRETTRRLSLRQSALLFGSTPTRGQKPVSLYFPRGRNPRVMRPGALPLPRPRGSRDDSQGSGGRRHHRRHHPLQLMAGASLLACISRWLATDVHLPVPGDASLANRDHVAAAARSTSRSSTSTSASSS